MTTAIMVANEAAVEVTNNFSKSFVESWLNFNADKAETTIKTYSKALKYFVGWLAYNNVENPQRQDIIRYREHLVETKKVSTARLYLVAVKSMFRWLSSEGFYRNISADVKSPSLAEESETHSREPLSLTEARQVLHCFDGKVDEKSLRDALILRIMLNCGLRSVEIVRLDTGDIEKRHGKIYLRVWGKARAGKVQRVEIPKKIFDMIQDYLNARHSKRERGEAMFVSTSRRNRGQRLQTQSVSRLAKATFRACGIDSESVTCHSCRHFTATELLLHGTDIRRVAKLLRHRSVMTTETYAADLRRANDDSVQKLSALLDAA